jgi:hypothetical protein
MDNNTLLDEDLAEDKSAKMDSKLHQQLKIFWIIMILLKLATTLPSLAAGGFNVVGLIYAAIPVIFFYAIVIKKNQKFIAWGLLYLIIVTLQTLIILVQQGYVLGENISISYLYSLPIILILILFGYQIWVIVLHAKYKLE